MLGPMSSSSSTSREVFRQRSSLLLAAVCAVTGVLLLLSLARSWSSSPQPLFAAWVIFGLALTWAIFVRPAVVLDDRGVTLLNVLREVHIPWAQLTDVTSRWNVRVFAGDKGYNAWAISSQAERPRPGSSGFFGMRSAGLPNVTNAPRVSHPTVVSKVTAKSVADAIIAAKQEYDEAIAQGSVPQKVKPDQLRQAPDGGSPGQERPGGETSGGEASVGEASGEEASSDDLVRVRWVPEVIVVLLAAAVTVLGLTYLG
jgi:hypothetical protein